MSLFMVILYKGFDPRILTKFALSRSGCCNFDLTNHAMQLPLQSALSTPSAAQSQISAP